MNHHKMSLYNVMLLENARLKELGQSLLTFLFNVAFCWFPALDHPIAGIIVPGGSLSIWEPEK